MSVLKRGLEKRQKLRPDPQQLSGWEGGLRKRGLWWN